MARMSAVAFLLVCLLTPPLHAQAPPVPPLTAGLPQCDGHIARVAPVTATHVKPPYPPVSQRLGEQGTTLLRVTLNPDGSVAGDALVRSSGSQRLDEAALEFVKSNWRWAAMPDCTTQVNVGVNIVWGLVNAGPVMPLDTALVSQVMHFINADPAAWPETSARVSRLTSAVVFVTADGTVAQVQRLHASGDAAIDQKSLEIVRARRWTPPRLDDKAVGGFLAVAVVWTPPGEIVPDPAELARVIQLFAPPPP